MRKIFFISMTIFALTFVSCSKDQSGSGSSAQTASIQGSSSPTHADTADHFLISDISYVRDPDHSNTATFQITFSQELQNKTLASAYDSDPQKASVIYLENMFLYDLLVSLGQQANFQQLKQEYHWEQLTGEKKIKGTIALFGIADKTKPDEKTPIALGNSISIQVNLNALPAIKDSQTHLLSTRSYQGHSVVDLNRKESMP